jgi:hypothetical protein
MLGATCSRMWFRSQAPLLRAQMKSTAPATSFALLSCNENEKEVRLQLNLSTLSSTANAHTVALAGGYAYPWGVQQVVRARACEGRQSSCVAGKMGRRGYRRENGAGKGAEWLGASQPVVYSTVVRRTSIKLDGVVLVCLLCSRC